MVLRVCATRSDVAQDGQDVAHGQTVARRAWIASGSEEILQINVMLGMDVVLVRIKNLCIWAWEGGAVRVRLLRMSVSDWELLYE
jgi:hypothetical protein